MKHESKFRRWLSLVLCLCMVLSMMPNAPLVVRAADEAYDTNHTGYEGTSGVVFEDGTGSGGEQAAVSADADAVSYIEYSWDGTTRSSRTKTVTDYVLCDSSISFISSGWYVIKDTVSTSNFIAVTDGSTANIILMDGAKLYAKYGMGDTIYVCGVYEADSATHSSGVIAYSIGKYCVNKAATASDVQDLAQATAVYGYYAKENFNNQANAG